MKIESIEEVLDKKQLRMIGLRALQPTREPYHAMLLQPHGEIEVSDNRIGHANRDVAYSAAFAFLSTAVEKHVDLVVTPEYYLPWSVAKEIAARKLYPPEGSIWVLGCESITPDELTAIAPLFNSESTYLYHEEFEEGQKAQKRFIDPLLYVFWSANHQDRKVLTFLVQFKTAPCKDKLDLEQRSLYLGRTVYSFNRGINKIGLLTIICSDAFEFKNDLVDEYHTNCLLIHIQLNPKPGHSDYAAYRTHLHSIGSNSHVELLSLNWSRNVVELKAGGQPDHWNNIAGSAWYVPSSQFSGIDQLVNDAHHHGLYYSIVSTRWHTFYFNYEPQILLVQKQKLLLFPAPQVLTPSSCITVVNRWHWIGSDAKWVARIAADDGFSSLVATYPSFQHTLQDEVKANPVSVERALELLVGPAGKPNTWFHLQELASMKVEAEESICRVTVNQENDPARRGVVFRQNRLQRAQDSLTLPSTKSVPWPASVRDLADGFKFRWDPSLPHCNIISLSGSASPASLAYLADQSDDQVVASVYLKLLEAISSHAVTVASKVGGNVEVAVTRAKDRLCVVYRRDHSFAVFNPGGNNRLDKAPRQSAVDITDGPS